MSNHLDELRTARKEGRPQHSPNTSNKNPDRFLELRTPRREGGLLQQPNISKKRDGTTEETHPRSRCRRPTPHQVEYHHPEGVAELYPKGDSPLIDDLRRRVRSPPPPRTRAPTPHPRASAPRKTKKTVRWADPLEQPTPQRIRSEEKRGDSESPKEGGEETQKEVQSCTIRRYRPSSIPRPKGSRSGAEISKPSRSDRRPTPSFTIELVLAPQAGQPPQRSLSPLIPQAIPAPLRISPTKTSTRQTMNAIAPSISAPEPQVKPSTRVFSFEDQPEVITLSPDRRPPHKPQDSYIAKEKPSSAQSNPFSYLKERPRRRGTVRPPLSEAKPASAVVVAESSTPSLLSSSSTTSFHTAKSSWSNISDSRKNRDSSASKSPSHIKPGSGPSHVTLAVGHASKSPSKAASYKISSPSSASNSTFNAVKSFWSEISSSSSCGAIVDGAEDKKLPCGPLVSAGRAVVCKTSKVAELARYTVNRPVNEPSKAQGSASKIPISRSGGGSVGGDRPKSRSKIPVPFTPSYHVTKTQQSQYVPFRAVSGVIAPRSSAKPPVDAGSSMSGSSSSLSYRTARSDPGVGSDSDAPAPVSRPKTTSTALTNDSVQDENTPSLQSQLWRDVLKLCKSESSTCPLDCNCDDCICSRQDDLDRCSIVAHVDDGECREW